MSPSPSETADPERAVDGVTPLRNPDEYLGQNRRTNGPWDASQYLADQAEAYQQRVTKLKTRVAEYGPVAAEEFEQQHDSDYRLPESLKATTPSASTRAIRPIPVILASPFLELNTRRSPAPWYLMFSLTPARPR